MSKKLLFIPLALLLAISLIAIGCPSPTPTTAPPTTAPPTTKPPTTAPPAAPEKILIGNPIALSGVNVAGAEMSQTLGYDLWVEEVNAKGGIYVAEYDKQIPVEMIRYDDKSDAGMAVQLTEKLILEDKVHIIFPPWGTAYNFAIAPVINKYKYPVIGVTVSSEQCRG